MSIMEWLLKVDRYISKHLPKTYYRALRCAHYVHQNKGRF